MRSGMLEACRTTKQVGMDITASVKTSHLILSERRQCKIRQDRTNNQHGINVELETLTDSESRSRYHPLTR